MQGSGTGGRDEGAKLAALWRERFCRSQQFEPSPYPEALQVEDGREQYVTFAVISDTHGKHGKFAGYEVPTASWEGIEPVGRTARGYFTAGAKTHVVAAEIAKVVASVSDEFLDAPLGTVPGQVYTGQLMSVLPVVLLSGNRKGVVVPTVGLQEGVVIPYADVLIHCGDITMKGGEGEMESFCQFIAQLPHKLKIVVAGNHDISLDKAHFSREDVKKKWKLASAPKDLPARLKKRLAQAGVVYLEDEPAELNICDESQDGQKTQQQILEAAASPSTKPPSDTSSGSTTLGREAGTGKEVCLRFFGSPIQPAFHDWAFQKESGQEIAEHWRRVLPGGGCDVLITHGPPLGRGDRFGLENPDSGPEQAADASASESERRALAWGDVTRARAGCPELLQEVQGRVRPLLHLFGHVHSDWEFDSSDGTTVYVNASLTDKQNNLRKGARVKTLCVPRRALLSQGRRNAGEEEVAAEEASKKGVGGA